jgi:hypothetical protein
MTSTENEIAHLTAAAEIALRARREGRIDPVDAARVTNAASAAVDAAAREAMRLDPSLSFYDAIVFVTRRRS